MTQVALVTGGSSGIGLETAAQLQQHGFEVYAAARRVEAMRPLADAGVHTFAMDVTDDSSMIAGIERIISHEGRIDVLVNNAGYGSYGPVEDVPLDEGRRQFDVNLFGMARLIQLVTPRMRAQGNGRIINVSSIGGKIYEPLGAWYHATKFAVEGLSDSLRLELRPFGIPVIIIEPGPVLTEWNAIARDRMVKTAIGGAYEDRARQLAQVFERIDTPKRSSTPDVVARKIVKAATTRRPKTRYPVGKQAAAAVRARKMLSDRAMDAVITRTLT